MNAVFLDFATVSNGDVTTHELDRTLPGLEYFDATTAAELPGRLRNARVVLDNKVRIGDGDMAHAPELELICLAATGTDNIDLDAARRRGIAVCNIRAYCTDSVVQHVFAMILSLTRRLAGYQARLEAGAWRSAEQFCLLEFPIRELTGKTLGIVGLGELGGGVARLGAALGMQVVVSARPGQRAQSDRVSLEEVITRSDVLSLHCPLTPETRGLIGARELARMKPDAVLINTARGALVDTAALAGALREGRLGGAGIDVLPQEPPVDGDPLLAGDIPNLIVTPHIAWAALEARQRAVDEMAANVAAFARGERRNRIA